MAHLWRSKSYTRILELHHQQGIANYTQSGVQVKGVGFLFVPRCRCVGAKLAERPLTQKPGSTRKPPIRRLRAFVFYMH